MNAIYVACVQQTLRNLFNDKNTSDFEIRFESSDTVLYVHKFILKLHSKMFHDMFSEANDTGGTVTLDDNDEHMKVIINSLYTSQLVCNEADTLKVLCLTIKYEFSALKEELLLIIQDRIRTALHHGKVDSHLVLMHYFRETLNRLNFEPENTHFKSILDTIYHTLVQLLENIRIIGHYSSIGQFLMSMFTIVMGGNTNNSAFKDAVFKSISSLHPRFPSSNVARNATLDITQVFGQGYQKDGEMLLWSLDEIKQFTQLLSYEAYRKFFDQLFEAWVDHDGENREQYYRPLKKLFEAHVKN